MTTSSAQLPFDRECSSFKYTVYQYLEYNLRNQSLINNVDIMSRLICNASNRRPCELYINQLLNVNLLMREH